jgi:hypothetical protein
MSGNPNFLPESDGVAFVAELTALAESLAAEGSFKEKYLVSELLTKYCDTSTTPPSERRSRAIDKWLGTEKRNGLTNSRLQLGDTDFGWATSDDIIAKARSIISKVLGEVSMATALCVGNHTNGASPRIRRGPLAAIQKHSGKAQGTSSALLHWSRLSEGTVLEDQEVEVSEGSVLFTVPKKSDIDRVACKEPEINLFLQRGVGDHIRSRLRRSGIDLNDQSRNQELARQAVELGLATIDLSSASDSISKQLVFELLPFEWWSYLDDIRCHSAFLPDHSGKNKEMARIELEMFSSMGNGFTFELESLIFWALTRTVCWLSGVKGKVSVYGDDIIAPSRIVPRLIRVFHWFGFTVNPAKSAWTGGFRESCGKHYHNGRDVTPFYLRGPVKTKTDLIRVLNRLLEWDGREWGFIVTPCVLDFHHKWSNHIPRRLWGGQDPDDITSLVTGHRPRCRLLRRTKVLRDFRRPAEGFEEAALLRWHSLRRVSQELEIDASAEGRYYIGKQPPWTVSSTWTPWLLLGGLES